MDIQEIVSRKIQTRLAPKLDAHIQAMREANEAHEARVKQATAKIEDLLWQWQKRLFEAQCYAFREEVQKQERDRIAANRRLRIATRAVPQGAYNRFTVQIHQYASELRAGFSHQSAV